MKHLALFGFGGATLLAVLAGCSTMQGVSHKYMMRGQILESAHGTVYLCVGTADGAKKGQQLVAYRFVRGTTLPSSKSAAPSFRREKTGIIEIIEIVDEHYAQAKVVSGEVNQGNMVELE